LRQVTGAALDMGEFGQCAGSGRQVGAPYVALS
jgi:hypothetical protein